MIAIERIIELMENKNLKYADLAKFLNVRPSVVSSWKTRKTNPPVDYIIQICEFLEVNPIYLLTGKEDNNQYIFTEEEVDLLEKYNLLTEKNKGKVDQFILERIKEQQ